MCISVLRNWVGALLAGGLLEEREAEALAGVVSARLQQLERHGPTWRQPSVASVLANLPLLRGADEAAVLWLRGQAVMRSYQMGDCIWRFAPSNSRSSNLSTVQHHSGQQAVQAADAPPGFFIVISGLVRCVVGAPRSAEQEAADPLGLLPYDAEAAGEVFLAGMGGTGGLLACVLGHTILGE